VVILWDNFEYDLDGTPCEAVLQGEMSLYQDGVQALFPKDEGLVEMAAQRYIAVPLSDRSGGVLGHLALIDVKPMPMAPRDLSVFTIFAARARVELERKRAEEARARSEERLSSVLALGHGRHHRIRDVMTPAPRSSHR
jgi:formate hydrogenlyase transcriptional activator